MKILLFFHFSHLDGLPKRRVGQDSQYGTVVDVYALQTHTNHEIEWEYSLKQIGP